jgi:FkbM family methyltransferase
MFEPDPTNFALINRTIRKNAINDCRALQIALSDSCGKCEFVVDHASGTTGAIKSSAQGAGKNLFHNKYQLQETISCATATMDSLLADGFTPPGLVKIDVEGAERLVLAGADLCLTKHHPTLIVETYKEPVIARLTEMGYRAFQIDPADILFLPAHAAIDFARVSAVFPERPKSR